MGGNVIDITSGEDIVLSFLENVTTEQITGQRDKVFKLLTELGKGDFKPTEMREVAESVSKKMSITDIQDYLVKVEAYKKPAAMSGGLVNNAMEKVLKEKQAIVDSTQIEAVKHITNPNKDIDR
jgi:hypothetical protein